MQRVVTQSLFTTQAADSRSLRSYVTSGVVHAILIAAAFFITFPAMQQMKRPQEHVTLLAPPLPVYKPKIQAPAIRRPMILAQQIANPARPKPVIPPPMVKPPEIKTQILAKAPELKPTPVVPDVKMEMPPAPKPQVHTGVFASDQSAKAQRVPNEVKTGGFGDPNGVHPSDSQSGKLLMAKVGAFDLPNGDGRSGGGGQAQSGGVRSAGFGSAGDPNGVPGGTGRAAVRTGGFGDGTVASGASGATQAAAAQPTTTPVEILFKPKPAYTDEARNLRLEGRVSLDVVFMANGSIKIVRILRGLGHGLDEAAQQAAMQVRFRPATRGGVPIDANATIYIIFELS